MIDAFITSFVIIIFYFILFYLIALKQGIYNTVDIAYGTGFIIVALVSLFLSNSFSVRKLSIIILITLWAIRIVYFLLTRNYGKDSETHEDKRLKNIRDVTNGSVLKGFLFLYIPQLIFVMLVSLPVMVLMTYSEGNFTNVDLIIGLIFLIGLLYESVSDYQLAKFKNNPDNKEKVFASGLWKFSQHPNYLGEIIVWWSIWLASIFFVPIDQFIWTIVGTLGPILITLSLLKASGIPLLNKRFEGNSDYDNYKQKTNVLIPFLY